MSTTEWRFKVEGNPVPKARPRWGPHGIYTPKKSKKWEAQVAASAVAKTLHRQVSEKALHVEMLFLMEKPAYLKKKKYELHHSKRPDLDNLAKAVLDGLQGVLLKNDSQIIWLKAHKRYATDMDKGPGVWVTVREIPDYIY